MLATSYFHSPPASSCHSDVSDFGVSEYELYVQQYGAPCHPDLAAYDQWADHTGWEQYVEPLVDSCYDAGVRYDQQQQTTNTGQDYFGGATATMYQEQTSYMDQRATDSSTVVAQDAWQKTSWNALGQVETQQKPMSRTTESDMVDEMDMQDSIAEQDHFEEVFAEYGDEYIRYLQFREQKTTPFKDFMDHQPEVTWKHRASVVEWLSDVQTYYRLRLETLQTAVNLMDRFLCICKIQLKDYQAIAGVCLWIASKNEENHGYALTARHIVKVCANNFTATQLCGVERVILNRLGYDFAPVAENFRKHYSKRFRFRDRRIDMLASYLLETAMLHRRFFHFRTSSMAVAALLLAELIVTGARRSIDSKMWSYMSEFFAMCAQPSEFYKKKYSERAYRQVSSIFAKWLASRMSKTLPRNVQPQIVPRLPDFNQVYDGFLHPQRQSLSNQHLPCYQPSPPQEPSTILDNPGNHLLTPPYQTLPFTESPMVVQSMLQRNPSLAGNMTLAAQTMTYQDCANVQYSYTQVQTTRHWNHLS